MNSLELKIPPPLVALFVTILTWLTPTLTGSLSIPLGLRHGVALALLCLGLSVAVSGVVAFRRARTTVNPIKASSASALNLQTVQYCTARLGSRRHALPFGGPGIQKFTSLPLHFIACCHAMLVGSSCESTTFCCLPWRPACKENSASAFVVVFQQRWCR